MAAWDAWKERATSFYDSYDDFAKNKKRKGYSIVPELDSSHVETYETQGVTQELAENTELWCTQILQQTMKIASIKFYRTLTPSQFDLIKKDHKDFADEKIITLGKALKKFLTYEKFILLKNNRFGERFIDSYGSILNGYRWVPIGKC